MGTKDGPTTPKPHVHMKKGGGFVKNKECGEDILEDIAYYKNTILPNLLSIKPLLFKSKWQKVYDQKLKELSDLEYKVLKYTNKEIYDTVEELSRSKICQNG